MNYNILNLEENLKNRIFGQNHIIDEVVSSVYICKADLGDETKPMASFLFTGPTGVGKTELVKELAQALNMNFERFDMSEYSDEYSAKNLTGSSAGLVGYTEGGLLTNAIKDKPNTILLLDEIEKADKSIYNTFLQVLDYGTLTDSKGNKIDFTKTIIVMTSNLGVDKNSKIEDFLSPELRNRIDKILTFNYLSKEIIMDITDKFLNDFSKKLRLKNISLTISSSAKDHLNILAFDKKMGARSVNRAINNEFKNNIAKEVLFGKLHAGGTVSIDYQDEKFLYEYIDINDNPFTKILAKHQDAYDFKTYEEAIAYAKANVGVSITRSEDGQGYMIKT